VDDPRELVLGLGPHEITTVEIELAKTRNT